jgi:hypothetical protein
VQRPYFVLTSIATRLTDSFFAVYHDFHCPNMSFGRPVCVQILCGLYIAGESIRCHPLWASASMPGQPINSLSIRLNCLCRSQFACASSVLGPCRLLVAISPPKISKNTPQGPQNSIFMLFSMCFASHFMTPAHHFMTPEPHFRRPGVLLDLEAAFLCRKKPRARLRRARGFGGGFFFFKIKKRKLTTSPGQFVHATLFVLN